jgi:FO synthase
MIMTGQEPDIDWLAAAPLDDVMRAAARRRDETRGTIITYSRKVFIPLTRLCRDTCHYCTFAKTPRQVTPYLSPDEVLAIAREGKAAGCTEALFTLGDKPELRYQVARDALAALGHTTTIDYLAAMCARVLNETGLLPHVNPGVMTAAEIASLRAVSASQGLMLENVSARLCQPGGPHHGSPDKLPAARLATMGAAGELSVPFTTGILIGIGETFNERIASLIAIRDLHRRHGHIQEVIVQNFRAKPGTRMAAAAEPGFEDLLRTVAAARLILDPDVSVQAPPNLSPEIYPRLIAAGIDDWGGVSPVTADHVNPEAPWPQIDILARSTAAAGKTLVARLPVYPRHALAPSRWLAPLVASAIRRESDSDGYARNDTWSPGLAMRATLPQPAIGTRDPKVSRAIARATSGARLDAGAIVDLFAARGHDLSEVIAAADDMRRRVSGDVVHYIVNRNINYTNICTYRCRFCAFSKGKTHEALRGRPYDLNLEEIARRSEEAWARGATEVCLQGGIHPNYTGQTYLDIVRTIRSAVPGLHIHAFSPLEISQGAATLGLPVATFLAMLKDAGLGSLPGTAAEILDDEVRSVICPDKLTSAEWLAVIEAAHGVGLRTTATVMYGHVERPVHWARHLLAIRDLQERTGGFTEFVPLPFVHMEAPMYLRGEARKGPTLREAVLMHAVARLALLGAIANIQTSWVKMGPDGAASCLDAGANDLGGTLMNESITRAAGTLHGQELPPREMDDLIRRIGREPRQRTTLYGAVAPERIAAAWDAVPLVPLGSDQRPHVVAAE